LLKGSNELDDRVPAEVGTIQVNFCKNPQCQNFGVPASTERQPRDRGAKEGEFPNPIFADEATIRNSTFSGCEDFWFNAIVNA
jgi:hypothetical protein